MSYSDLITYKGKTLHEPSYIEFYLNGSRVREYTGACLYLLIEPDKATTIRERDRLLAKLEYEIHKALDTSAYPATEFTIRRQQPISELLMYALNLKLEKDLSLKYKTALKYYHKDFTKFLTTEELAKPITQISTSKINEYLNRGNPSVRTYTSRRISLSAFYTVISKYLDLDLFNIRHTEPRKIPGVLHEPFTKEQLNALLEYLKIKSPKLHLMCLIVYGCFLRPHREVRLLRMRHLKHDCSEIHLSGMENKGKNVRLIPVPDYVQKELKKLKLKHDDYIFSNEGNVNHLGYFSVLWFIHRPEMLKLGLIKEKQSIYTLRYTASVNVYRQTKDIYIIQRLMGHSKINTTVIYLTSLGIIYREVELKTNMPTLDI